MTAKRTRKSFPESAGLLEKLTWYTDKNGPGGCWLWTGSKNRDGFGIFSKARAHRISYELFVGEIPADMFVFHSCDNRLCVNPEHLYAAFKQRKVASSSSLDNAIGGEA